MDCHGKRNIEYTKSWPIYYTLTRVYDKFYYAGMVVLSQSNISGKYTIQFSPMPLCFEPFLIFFVIESSNCAHAKS